MTAITDLDSAATRLRSAEESTRAARADFHLAFLAARDAGHSLRELAKVTGLTFGRLHQIERRLRDAARED